MLIKNDLLNSNAIIIFETSDENNFSFEMKGFEIKKKKYGNIVVFKMVKV